MDCDSKSEKRQDSQPRQWTITQSRFTDAGNTDTELTDVLELPGQPAFSCIN